MILYNQKSEMIGVSSKMLNFIGYDNMEELLTYTDDIANFFINKPGHVYKFDKFSWIEFILYSGSLNKKALLKLRNDEEVEVEIKACEIFLAQNEKNYIINFEVYKSENFFISQDEDIENKNIKDEEELILESVKQSNQEKTTKFNAPQDEQKSIKTTNSLDNLNMQDIKLDIENEKENESIKNDLKDEFKFEPISPFKEEIQDEIEEIKDEKLQINELKEAKQEKLSDIKEEFDFEDIKFDFKKDFKEETNIDNEIIHDKVIDKKIEEKEDIKLNLKDDLDNHLKFEPISPFKEKEDIKLEIKKDEVKEKLQVNEFNLQDEVKDIKAEKDIEIEKDIKEKSKISIDETKEKDIQKEEFNFEDIKFDFKKKPQESDTKIAQDDIKLSIKQEDKKHEEKHENKEDDKKIKLDDELKFEPISPFKEDTSEKQEVVDINQKLQDVKEDIKITKDIKQDENLQIKEDKANDPIFKKIKPDITEEDFEISFKEENKVDEKPKIAENKQDIKIKDDEDIKISLKDDFAHEQNKTFQQVNKDINKASTKQNFDFEDMKISFKDEHDEAKPKEHKIDFNNSFEDKLKFEAVDPFKENTESLDDEKLIPKINLLEEEPVKDKLNINLDEFDLDLDYSDKETSQLDEEHGVFTSKIGKKKTQKVELESKIELEESLNDNIKKDIENFKEDFGLEDEEINSYITELISNLELYETMLFESIQSDDKESYLPLAQQLKGTADTLRLKDFSEMFKNIINNNIQKDYEQKYKNLTNSLKELL